MRSNSSAGAHQRKRAAAVPLNIVIRRKPESIHSRLVAKRERKGWTSAFAGGDGEFGELAAEQLLLPIDIFLRNVAGRDERIDAGLGHVTGILLEADVE